MSDTVEKVEKIYCHDGYGRNNDALAIAAMCNRNNNCDPMAMAMMGNGGFGGNWNNPFAYMMMMAMMRWLGIGDGYGYGMNGQNAQNIELQNQIQSLRSQLQDNQNTNLLRQAIGDGFNRNDFALSQLSQNLNFDFNGLKECCCQVQAAIQQVAGQVGFTGERVINAAQMGDMNIITQLKDCCCQNKELIQRMGYENQLGQKDIIFNSQKGFDFVNRSVERGFAESGFIAERNKCDVITAINAAQQRTADLLTNHWSNAQQREIQDLKAELSNLRQTERILGRMTGNPYYAGGNGCGCNGNNYGGF